jgi:hypothetical protein
MISLIVLCYLCIIDAVGKGEKESALYAHPCIHPSKYEPSITSLLMCTMRSILVPNPSN